MHRRILLIMIFFSLATGVSAQKTDDPTNWTYEVKKKSATDYELIFHLSLDEGWHIWSLKPGGDGFQIIPSFNFDEEEGLTLNGKVTEKGHKTTAEMEGVEGKVTYLSHKVDYIQAITVKKGTSLAITGNHEYQVCTDKLCLPPKSKDFLFEIRP